MSEEQRQRPTHEQHLQQHPHEQQPHEQEPQQQLGIIDKVNAVHNDNDDDVIMCEEDTLGKSSHAHIPLEQPATNESIGVTKNPFITPYMKSILSARDTIGRQWSECTWDKNHLGINAPASADEVKNLVPMIHMHICCASKTVWVYGFCACASYVLLIHCVDALVGQGAGQFEENQPLS
jgi:hypothetical protein